MTEQPRQTTVSRPADKAALRRAMIAAREALPAAQHRAASIAIRHHLAELLLAEPAGALAFCLPIRAEVDCRPLVATLHAAGWQAAVPVVVEMAAPMHFRAWWPGAPLGSDPYGIPVPETAPAGPPDVLLLPLVAWDDAGYRLGYGGGYFDRTLAALAARPPLTIGVGFDLCRVADLRPQPHDIRLDLIVTESGIRRLPGP